VLTQPETNLRLGTTYLRQVYDGNSGKWELTLAAYNAGASRVVRWLDWGNFREPAEFIETIPFSETRGYVVAVLRNAGMYRKLYGPGGLLAADRSEPAVAKPVPETKKVSAAKPKKATVKKAVARKSSAKKTVAKKTAARKAAPAKKTRRRK
jgi:soluble lytic murein transglycosylase